MNNPSEKIIETRIILFLREIGVEANKIQSVGIYDSIRKRYRKPMSKIHRNGISDILACYKGRFIAIEVKSKKGRPSPDQLKFLTDIQKAGGIAFISRSVTQTFDQLKGFFPELVEFTHIKDKWAKLENN